MRIEGMSETMAHNLFQSGFGSLELLSQADVETLMHIPGYEEEEAAKTLIAKATTAYELFLKEEAEKPKEESSEVEAKKTETVVPQKSASAGGKDAKSLADARLKEQMAELDSASTEDAGESKEASTTD